MQNAQPEKRFGAFLERNPDLGEEVALGGTALRLRKVGADARS